VLHTRSESLNLSLLDGVQLLLEVLGIGDCVGRCIETYKHLILVIHAILDGLKHGLASGALRDNGAILKALC